MAQSGEQGLGLRYAAVCGLACMLLAANPVAFAADDDASPTASSVSGDLQVQGAPVTLAVAPQSSAAAQAPAAIADAPPASPSSAVPFVTEPAAEPHTQSASSPGEAPAAEPRHGNGGILALHSDIKFGLLAAPRQAGEQAAANAAFAAQVKRIAASLESAAKIAYPEAMARIGAFDVYIGESDELGTMSSGSGRIAINGGIAKLNPTDDWLAFVIAREMGHVVAGHHDSNSGASIVVSLLMNLVVPGSGLIKSAIAFAGSQIAAGSKHDKQLVEADAAAVKLLDGAGYPAKSVVLNLKLNPLSEETSKGSWAESFRTSTRNLIATVDGPRAAAPALALDPAQAQTFVGVASAPASGQAPAQMAVQSVQSLAAPPAAFYPPAQPVFAPAVATAPSSGRWEPEEVVRTRPSGLPGPLISGGGFAMPVRRIE